MTSVLCTEINKYNTCESKACGILFHSMLSILYISGDQFCSSYFTGPVEFIPIPKMFYSSKKRACTVHVSRCSSGMYIHYIQQCTAMVCTYITYNNVQLWYVHTLHTTMYSYGMYIHYIQQCTAWCVVCTW